MYKERRDNDPCELCGILDGITVTDNFLVCYKCNKTMKKQKRIEGRKHERQLRQTETTSFYKQRQAGNREHEGGRE